MFVVGEGEIAGTNKKKIITVNVMLINYINLNRLTKCQVLLLLLLSSKFHMIKLQMIKFHIIAMLELLLWSLTNLMVWVQRPI